MKFQERREKIEKLQKQLKVLKEECNHPKSQVTVKANGSSGNYDPSDNRSWDEFKCRVCGHFWTKDH